MQAHRFMRYLPESFRQLVAAPNDSDCWMWLGPVHPSGEYGIAPGKTSAHVWSYKLHHGGFDNPRKKVVRTCRGGSLCVNPSHLKLVRR